jgi:tRNA threonylcarbamoyladenosine biosynthesis protein TsaB
MATILNIETSTEICSVSISVDGVCRFLKLHKPDAHSSEKSSHSLLLATFIDEILKENGYKASDIDAVAISAGPGSYTGLRIGVSTAKGFAFGAGLPLIAVDTMKIIASMAIKTINTDFDYIVPMTDARRMEVYCAVFDKNLNQISPIEAKIIDELSFSELSGGRVVICGNGAEKCLDILQNERNIFLTNVYSSAEYMAELSESLFNQGKFVDLVYFEPFYLKDFVATTPKLTFANTSAQNSNK